MTMKYTKDHEWLKIEGDIATVGITHHAQDALGDVVFVDLPEVGALFAQKEVAGADPALANSDPLGAGWFFKVKLSDASQLAALMDETSYTKFAA
jgi:glycine cleavage system H protein